MARVWRGLQWLLVGGSWLVPVLLWGQTSSSPIQPPRGFFPAAESVPDEPYLQEVTRPLTLKDPITSLAVVGSQLWVGTARGAFRYDGKELVTNGSLPGTITRLRAVGDQLWAIQDQGLFRRETSDSPWQRVGTNAVDDVAFHRGQWLAASGRQIWTVAGTNLALLGSTRARFDIRQLIPHQDSLWILGPGRLTPYAFGQFGGRDAYDFPADEAWDWGTLPSPRTRDALSLGNRLVIATDRGLGVLRGMSLDRIAGEEGLPFEDVTCLARGFTNDLWIGTSRGLIRQVGAEFHYYAGRRWLPDDRVRAIAVRGREVWIGTEQGLALIEFVPFTLAKKAAYYEQHLETWGQKRLGLVHKLEWDDPLQEFVREAGDNDGGYTGYYLAAQAYRWAVTRDPQARAEAMNTFEALCWLETMTGIPGFPARSVWAKGEHGHKSSGGSGGYPAEWHDTADGLFEWKGDTSSDELCSHFYAFALFLELAAQGEEIPRAKAHLSRIASHLIDHHWQLIDRDGKPTRWGRWDPEYFLSDEGRYDRGLQAVELLSFIKTAEVLTGDPKFATAYQRLVELGYPAYTLRWRNTFPPDSILHFLDELAFWSFGNLLRYEQDPERRALYRRAYERGFEVVRVEHNPWFNFLYGALTGEACEVQPAVRHLRDWPLDLRVWSYQNSHRADLRTPAGYRAPKGGTVGFSPRETEPLRWDHWTMQADGGTGGRDVVEPASWLLAYWMARYHGFIGAPSVKDSRLTEVIPGEVPAGGARRYEGPARPRPQP